MNEPYAAFLGIDWADAEHAVCLLAGDKPERKVVLQEPAALDAWAAELRARFGGRPLAVCLEASRGPLVYALMKYEFLVLFPINPRQLSSYRDAFRPSGAKNDPGDAELLARFLREHHEHLRAWRPDDVATRSLRMLGEARRQWVDQRTAAGNRLLQALKEAYPLALRLIGRHVYAVRLLALLVKFPAQRELQRASPQLLGKWIKRLPRLAGDMPADASDQQRVQAIRQAPALVTDAAVLAANRLAVLHLAKQLQMFNATIAEYDKQLAERTLAHADAALFRSFPGAGNALTPRLIAAFGADRERFQSAEELQRLSGVAPVQVQSGKSCVVKRRWQCPAFLRQTFHEFARCSLLCCDWAQAYCALQKKQGKSFHAIVRALAFKWQRIMFRCWKTGQPYDDARYVAQLRAKRSPLLAYLPASNSTEKD